MPNKKNAKPIWIGGPIYASFKAKLDQEGWKWGITKKVESLMEGYLTGNLLQKGQSVVDTRVIGAEVLVPVSLVQSLVQELKALQDRNHEGKRANPHK